MIGPLRAEAAAQRLSALRLALRLVWEGGRGWTAGQLALVVVQSLLPVAALLLQRQVVDAVVAGMGMPDKTAAFARVGQLVALLATVAGVGAILALAASYVAEVQSQLVTEHVQRILHRKSVEADLAAFESPDYFDRVYRAQADGVTRPGKVASGLIGLGRSLITLLAMGGLLLSFSPLIALILMVAVIPGVLVRVRFAGLLYRWQRDSTPRQRRTGYLGWVLTDAWHAKEVRLFGLGEEFMERFAAMRTLLRGERLKLSRSRALREFFVQLLGTAATFAVYLYAARLAVLGAISMGTLVMYDQAYRQAQGAIQELLNGLAGLYDDSLYLSNVDEFLRTEPTVVAPAKPVSLPGEPVRGVRLEGVDFTYPGASRPALHGVDLEIPVGKIVALVGANGSGKTTVAKLLCRLYDPTGGRITVDGIDLRQADPVDVRRLIAPVLQDFVRYSLTARENIAIGDLRRGPQPGEVEEAARSAGADRALEALPGAYDASLGRMFEGGQELSVGEWQKVALARAYYRGAPVQILDEPTSALDPAAESEFIDGLKRLATGRTTLLISHRLSTVRAADFIYVLSKGEVIERGTHEELLALDGCYAHYYRRQSEPYRDADEAAVPGAVPGPPTDPPAVPG